MQKLRELLKQDTEAGFTLVELMLSLVITAILAVGVTKLLTVTMQTVGYAQSSTVRASNVALVNSVINRDISASNGFVIPDTASSNTVDKSKICTSWSTGSSYASVRPILTLSVPITVQITSVRRFATYNEYTVASADINSLAAGQLATVSVVSSGSVNSADLSVSSAPISDPPAAGKFRVTVSTSISDPNAIAAVGTVTVNWFHGYEVRKILVGTDSISMGQLWTFTCPTAGSTSLINPRILREDLPAPAGSTVWINSVMCTDQTLAPTICTKNTSLTSLTDNPGIKFTIPASSPIKGSRSDHIYTQQIIQGARRIA